MNGFWAKIHGGSTHLPIALLIASVVFDALAFLAAQDARRRDLRAAAYYTLLLAALGTIPAILSGLIVTNWDFWGSGLLQKHHLYLWPASVVTLLLAGWRLRSGTSAAEGRVKAYLGLGALAAVLMGAAGYWGGEMLLGGASAPPPPPPGRIAATDTTHVAQTNLGQSLYARNCASCHSPDGSGAYGPPLKNLKMSDAQIAGVIQNGVPPRMPGFAKELNADQTAALASYVRSLK